MLSLYVFFCLDCNFKMEGVRAYVIKLASFKDCYTH